MLVQLGLSASAPGAVSTTTTLASSATLPDLGQAVTLTATVSPATATGKVTFYRGITVLGTAALTNGEATLATTLLPFGTSTLKAFYIGDGTYNFSVSSPLPITVSAAPASGFSPATDYVVGNFPQDISAGDLNGDGYADLVIVNYNTSNVSVLLGNADGTFRAAVNYPASFDPTTVTLGDFNGDGKLDIAVGGYVISLSVALGNGDGTFQPFANSFVPTSTGMILKTADFNGDGIVDLLVDSNRGGIQVLLGNGDGTFQNRLSFSNGSGAQVIHAALGDFNGDGNTDVVTADTNGAVYEWLGNGNATFTPVNVIPAAGSFIGRALVVGDFNGDGKADLAVTAGSLNNVTVMIGNGNGMFQTGASYATGFNPISIATGDFNGDGKADIVVGNGSGNASLLLGNGDGTLQPAVAEGGTAAAIALAVDDFNRDGRTDLAVLNLNLGVLLGLQGTAAQTISFPPLANVSLGTAPFTVSASASSGLPVTFQSNSNSVCTVSGSTISLVGAGTCSITASQAGNSTWPPATPVTQMFAVLQGSQTISFAPLSDVSYGVAPFTISATATSGLPVIFTSTTGAVCTVAGTAVSIIGVGTCSITANQAGNANYTAATSVTRTFTVASTFTVSASPTSISVAQGTNGTTMMTTAVSIGFNSAIALNASGLPPGATVSFSPASIAAPGSGSSTMTIAVATTTAIGSYAITVAGTAGSTVHTSTVTLTVTGALTIATASLPNGQTGVPYSAALTATGGIAPYKWQLVSGTLPAGLTLSTLTGQISGTPTVSISNTPLTFRVSDSTTPSAQTAALSLALTIASAPTTLTITTTSLPSGQTGTLYSAALTATGGTTPYSWQLVSGTLPAGLTLNTLTGQISGTPPAGITNTPLTFKVTDSTTPSAQSALVSLALTIASAPATLTITTTSLPSAQIGVPYATTLTAAGGTSPYMWTLTSRRLPSWLALNPLTGQISGTPAIGSTGLLLTVQVTDSTPSAQTATATLTLNIASAPATLTITTTSLPSGQTGIPYSAALAATGGITPYSWQLVSGTLPAGLTLNTLTGQISGTPAASITNSPLMFKVTDSTTPSAQTATVSLALTTAPAPATLTITTTSLPSGQTGVWYSAALAATGGSAPYNWQLVSGTLPAGLTLNTQTGQISGTPIASITNTPLMFKVTDSTTPSAQTATVSLALTTAPAVPTLAITTTSLPNGQTGVWYSSALAATGGSAPYNWQLVSGTLPAGLTLNPLSGQISGTPTTSITNTPLTFKVTDSTTPSAQTAAVSLALTIAPAPITAPPPATLTITTTSLPSGQTGIWYTAALAATGGTSPYTWALISGRMPAGLTLNPQTGQITGAPLSGLNTVLTFQVTDSSTPSAQTATVMLMLNVI
ncbi:MAG TPA: FG-GAP-like repeat-containing protein [Bryobacteraceae bacterium]|nr:FG-GAP-like repeat-containing protein [Bryobacteraceae bacterium]